MISEQVVLSAKYVVFIGLSFLTLLAGFLVALQWPIGSIGVVWLVALNKVLAEMLLVIAAALLFYSRWWPIRVLSVGIVLFYSLILYAQITSLQFSSAYLPPVALENAQHIDFLLDTNKLGWAIIILLALMHSRALIKKSIKPVPPVIARSVVAICLVVAASLIKNDRHWLSHSLNQQRFDFYNSGGASIEHQAPGSAMVDTLKLHIKNLARTRWIEQASIELPAESAAFAYEHGISLNAISTDFPLIKPIEFDSPPAFIDAANWQAKNTIVFFVEGMSSRIIQPYSQHFPSISPNFEDFAKQAVVVDNYYNHSYATYRGLSGQFCSIYANGHLQPDVNYRCLPEILGDNDFDTLFFVSQSLAETDLDEVAKIAGFQQVLGSKELFKYIPDDPYKELYQDEFILFDQSFVQSFNRWLQQKQPSEKPFFAALYNFQTHTGVRLYSDVKYRDPTGKSDSYILDTFHNFDLAFGEFWNYFKQSPYFRNTIVIVTTDHSTFSSSDFSKLVWDTPDYARVFADKIPMMIYHPDATPGSFDARRASSVNFAPSLMHLLGIGADVAPFLGNTIFDQSHIYPSPLVASSGISYVNVFGNHWVKQTADQDNKLPENSGHAKTFHDFVMYTQGLERSNRLMPE